VLVSDLDDEIAHGNVRLAVAARHGETVHDGSSHVGSDLRRMIGVGSMPVVSRCPPIARCSVRFARRAAGMLAVGLLAARLKAAG
jgi:hypothetical protein